jgi:hypothetical protein
MDVIFKSGICPQNPLQRRRDASFLNKNKILPTFYNRHSRTYLSWSANIFTSAVRCLGKGEVRNKLTNWDFINNGLYRLAHILTTQSHRGRICKGVVAELKTNPSSRQNFNHPRLLRRRRILSTKEWLENLRDSTSNRWQTLADWTWRHTSYL